MAFDAKSIKEQKFAHSFRGYNPYEVDTYLEMVSEKFDKLLDHYNQVKQKLYEFETYHNEFQQEKKRFKEVQLRNEKELKKLNNRAKKEARIVVLDAKLKAEEQYKDIYDKVKAARKDLQDLKELKNSYISKFRAQLLQQQDVLSMFAKIDNHSS